MWQDVVSREYKVMLKVNRFVGSEVSLRSQASFFWNEFKGSIKDLVFDTDGQLDEIENRRLVKFYDSDHQVLKKHNYSFRERVDLNTNSREVTLKFRHPDRYISQDRDMRAAYEKDVKTKFEEDIKPPFLKLYSFSSAQPISNTKIINKINDPEGLFPNLGEQLDNTEGSELISVVGDFTAKEIVVSGGDFQIGKVPKVEAECALIVWYDGIGQTEIPAVVEFSFRYKDKKERFEGDVAERAYEVFNRLINMVEWIDSEGLTKTAYVYSRVNS
ncbi:hypothetical protein [Microbulbifer epialgicus]|uniref:TIGR04255 family protein n=1 Tax=Microbulbifer epialgicus TaxID=393907 RepID=A0ABV4P6D8_9GAMM